METPHPSNDYSMKIAPGSTETKVVMGFRNLENIGQYWENTFPASNQVIVVTEPVIHQTESFGILEHALKKSGIHVETIVYDQRFSIKSWAGLRWICNEILKRRPTRQTALIAMGGGSVGDGVGLAASLILRGLPLVQIPTTLLSQVDSAIGGKTALDLTRGKNMIGQFYHPKLVWIDPGILTSLPPHEWSSGFAELVKTSMIASPPFFQSIESIDTKSLFALSLNPKSQHHLEQLEQFAPWIFKAAITKAKIVELDPYDHQQRRWLNFGHSFGHAIENWATTNRWGKNILHQRVLPPLTHGACVSMGMMLALKWSVFYHQLHPDWLKRVRDLLYLNQLPVDYFSLISDDLSQSIAIQFLVQRMLRDKKNTDQKTIQLVLLHDLGRPFLSEPISPILIREFLNQCRSVF